MRLYRGLWTALGIVSLACGVASAETLFSVAPNGPSGLDPGLIFEVGSASPVNGVNDRDIDGFSQDVAVVQFLLCFSVDAMSVGGPPPLTEFPPFNVTDQAAKNQAAGDAFISTEAFDRSGLLGVPPSLGASNNVLAINQSPNYIAEFGLMPMADPAASVPTGTPLDDVDGGGVASNVGGGAPPGARDVFYYTFSGTGGADIAFDGDPAITGAGALSTFAMATALGLDAADEIDALVVFDDNDNDVFDDGDQVLFSLARGSMSLATLAGGGRSAADVFSVIAGNAPTLFADATTLGLSSNEDNLNMLALVPLVNDARTTIEQKVIPEPSTLALCGFAAVGLASYGWRRRRALRA